MTQTQTIWKTPFSIEELNEKCRNTLISYLGIQFIEIGHNFLKACLPLTSLCLQPMGTMHGGVSCILAETVGSMAGNCCVDLQKEYCLGLNLFTNHLKTIKHGMLYATAYENHLGKTTQIWSIDIHDENQHLISVSRLTLIVRTKHS